MSLHISIHPRHAHAERWQRAFAAGLARHGLFPEWIDAAATESDLAVVWSVKDPVYAARRAAGRTTLVMEAGYLGDRLEWCALGYDGLNGRADFVNRDMPGDRWDRHFAGLLRPWRAVGETVLVLGQVPGDAALAGLDPVAWAEAMIREAQTRWPARPVRWRPHPAHRAPGRSLAEDLETAWLALTYNSTAGVAAALAGVPVVALDRGSMARPIAARRLEDAPARPDRLAWAHDLAYCQWTEAEVAGGEAWDHLKRKFD